MPLPSPVLPIHVVSSRPGRAAVVASADEIALVAVRGRSLEQVCAALERSGYRVEQIGAARPALPTGHQQPDGVLRIGTLTIDPHRHEIHVDGREVRCTATEFGVLERLATHPGHVLTREQLLEYLYGAARFRDRRTIDSHVRNLRRKLGEPTAARIVTVLGVGYKLAEVAETERSAMSAGIEPSSAPHSANDR